MHPIRFATFLAPNMQPVYEFIVRYVGEKLNRPTTLIVGSSFDQFAAGEADVGFICGLPYIRLRDQQKPSVELLAAPVLSGERYGGKPIYFSDVIVRRDSPIQMFADLRGRSWCYNDPDSQSGYNVVRYWLAQQGETCAYFGKVHEAGFHQRSIRLVCAGEIDASAIDTQVLAIELRDNPELASQLRIIDTIGPSPIQPVVAARHVSDPVKVDIRAVLLEMGHDPVVSAYLARGFVKGFAPVVDADYDPIRAMLAVVERHYEN